MTQYDYIVIGAGSAGCVVASRLSEDADAEVLLLEAGGPDDKPEIHDPLAWPTDALQGTEIDWQYKTAPQEHTAGRVHDWPRGKVLGGTSAINAMVYVRGHYTDFDHWAYQGCDGWDYVSVLPLFRKSEDHERGENEYHGVGGPLHTRFCDKTANPASAAYIEAALEVGYPPTDDFNGAQMQGTGWNTVTVTRDGDRASTAVAFLHPAMDRRNLTVTTYAHARRLLIDGGRCTGVEYSRNGTLERVHAAQEVVVCAGAIDSPRLLMLSGIGAAEDLRKLGIEVAVDLPGVGQNLHDHLLIGVVYEARKPVEPGRMNHSESTLFWARDERGIGLVPGMQVQFFHLPFAPPGFEIPEEGNGYTIVPGPNRVVSRGWLRLQSADPDDPPEINPNYLAEEADVLALLRGIEMAREIGAANALKDWNKAEVLPGKHVRSESELRDFVAHAAHTIYHPVGTCKMGIDSMSVVDPELRVYGIDGLRVADASIMPKITSGNVNAPTIMIGEKAADLIRSIAPQPARVEARS